MEFHHIPVLLTQTVEELHIRPSGIYFDGTLGGAGHSFEIAKRLEEGGRLIGIDQDEEAIEAAKKHLAPYADRVTIVHDNYEHIPEIAQRLGISQADGILLDIGVSSYQIDNPARGFSYNEDEPLDMRMDQENPVSAKTIVNTWSEEDLTRILRDYGEERYAQRIAANIAKEREEHPLETTGELVKIIRASIPMKMQEKYGNPCKRTFQAIRIACNRELDVLQDSIDGLIDLLAPGGRLCIITFHSLEDRIVKNAFRRNENPCTCPPEFPVCVCGKKSKGTVITKKPITASEEELGSNSRAASAKLRVFEKIGGTP
ncbi:MAG: 16S rRNA (cytosine(1402)-N(4))-methyltransferase RsmH [Lachnospiraceae bacterium]|jgi:16S rRNA (cytosine1402-N4)-methyltransferase|nr:16S rRNA (cytosine(1402)-N(4))-methyltransferase RsmH [Lachnospiraceae bacterium]MCI1398797.1 16S rRNA (cytosine(1402)-N(4))-methyltransferase RsmH [Lachnospiraceae bacterium]MCI1424862.1 16S rRNA (cytosine(1402)-N(4))-methyltransferase RsmH [Lachnospiraceae bacterium]MCI1453562.1 16S rRNA (cytosine(1402)-N(4))-methyltransferase RsmH [Lachnospiraceae bacterium]MDD5848377.1 16S rRNA (cytosine(1402)-N(4))-methyltransferase RsmH [Bacillota bacterium]